LLDLCGRVHPNRVERALDNAIAMKLVTVQQVGFRQERVGGTRAPAGRVDLVFGEATVVVEADNRRHHSSWLDVESRSSS